VTAGTAKRRHRIGGHRPPPQIVLAALALVLFAAPLARAAGELFDFEVLRYRAKMLALAPYAPRPARVPESLLKLTYDQHRRIQFNAAETWWRDERLPFRDLASPTRWASRASGSSTISTSPATNSAPSSGPAISACSAGKPSTAFRRAASRSTPPSPAARSFPCFEEFWVQKPAPDARNSWSLRLLDSPSVAGAYRLTILPGGHDRRAVRARAIYRRNEVKVIGWRRSRACSGTARIRGPRTGISAPRCTTPTASCSSAAAASGSGGRSSIPTQLRVAAFADENPRGFGLLQRDRDFEHYQDLEANYHLRPSVWVEPVGAWGRRRAAGGDPHAGRDQRQHRGLLGARQPAAAGRAARIRIPDVLGARGRPAPARRLCAATRLSGVQKQPELTRFLVDFDGPT
jgi:glucans biosynthesis protein